MAAASTRAVVQYSRHGDSSVLEYIADAPVPALKKGQVLVANKAAAVNPVDYKLRQGFGALLDRVAGPRLPAIPGGDVAGVVESAPEGSAFKPGDRVFGLLSLDTNFGGYASKVPMPERALALIPEALSFEQATCLPLAGLTAWQALEAARVKAGDRVLVHAGSGGVGSLAVQLAKARGAWVAATCSGRNAEFVKELGADEVVDYTTESFDERFKGQPFDAVVDTIVLNGYEQRSLAVTKRSGTYAMVVPSLVVGTILKGLLKSALWLGPRYRPVFVFPNGQQLAEIGRLAAEGKVKPIIASTYPLAKAAEAQDEIAKGRTRGKIVLTI
ncbi:hypothetical protein ABPG77_008513 [Micractinium sp. CCAP 211/92]